MNNKEKAAQNELETLKALANCGWMTTRLIALWVWTDSTTHVAVNKAQLALKRLAEKKLILERDTPVGMKAWVLTEAGADRVNATLEEQGYSRGWAHHGYDLSTLHYQKQITVVEYLIQQRKAGLAVVAKAGLRAGLLPEKFKDFDAVTVNFDSGYTQGVLVIGNSSEGMQYRVARCEGICNEMKLIGDPLIIRGLQKKLRARTA
jgi:hypothetical protein